MCGIIYNFLKYYEQVVAQVPGLSIIEALLKVMYSVEEKHNLHLVASALTVHYKQEMSHLKQKLDSSIYRVVGHAFTNWISYIMEIN